MSRGRLAALAFALATVAVAGAVAPAAPVAPVEPVAAQAGVTVDADDGVVTVAAGERQVVNGTADAPAGTRVTVRTRSTGDTQPQFIKSTTAVVRADGTWSAVLDFSQQGAGDAFGLTAMVDGSEATADGEVVACEGDCRDPAPDPTPTPVPTPTPTPDPAATDDDAEADGLGDVDVAAEGANVTVAAGARQVVNGTAEAPAGTGLTVRVRSTGDTQPQFIRSARAVVREDGTWSVGFDFSRQSAGDTFEVSVLGVGDGGASARGEVVACEGDCRDPAPDPTPTPSPTPAATDRPATGLAQATVTVNRGDAAGVALRFGDADALRVSIGNPELGYRVNATVRDANGDGESRLIFDTEAAGHEGATLSVPAGDEVAITDEVRLDAPIPTGDYDVTVRRGTDAGGETVDVGTLFVAESNTVTASTDDEPSATPAATTAGGADGGGVLDGVAVVLVGAAFLLGGAGVALLVLRR